MKTSFLFSVMFITVGSVCACAPYRLSTPLEAENTPIQKLQGSTPSLNPSYPTHAKASQALDLQIWFVQNDHLEARGGSLVPEGEASYGALRPMSLPATLPEMILIRFKAPEELPTPVTLSVVAEIDCGPSQARVGFNTLGEVSVTREAGTAKDRYVGLDVEEIKGAFLVCGGRLTTLRLKLINTSTTAVVATIRLPLIQEKSAKESI